jgi:glycosyltransferase involved in cell wall biosynthesis
MTRVVALRPGVTRNRSAFEAMALIYDHLERTHDYEFIIVHSTTESYEHPRLETSAIPPKAWKPTVPHTPVFLRRFQYRRHIDPLIQSADAVLTVDPTIFPQGSLVIERAHALDTPVWFDASKTIAEPDPHWYAIRPRIRQALERTTGIVTTVPKVLERYRDLGLFDAAIAAKFTMMGHPVDTDAFSPLESATDRSSATTDPVSVLAMTRLVPEKGVYYLLEAMEPLLRSGKAELRFLGTGPMQSLLEREANERGVDEAVEFLGTVPHEEVPTVLRDADVFVNHAVSIDSWEEYFGAANLEAMACGLPTVVTDCGGIPYVIRDRDVVEMVSQRDIDDLREAIERLVGDPQYRRKLGRAGRTYVEENYSVEQIAAKYHEMLQRGIQG